MSRMFVGIDVSKDKLDVACCTHERGAFLGTYVNAPAGFKRMAQRIDSQAQELSCEQIHVIVEPTGGYEQRVACFSFEKSWDVSLPNPYQVRRWAQAKGRRGKTDRHDAQVLADFGSQHELSLWRPLPEQVATLQALLDRRAALEKMIRQEENRKESFRSRQLYQDLIKQNLDDTLERLKTSLAEINQALEEHINQDPQLHFESTLLKQVPGVGDIGCPKLLAIFHRFDTLTAGQGTAKQLVAYVGLDPQPHESGSSVHRRAHISHKGNGSIRAQLYMGAMGGSHAKDTPLTRFINRLLAAGKPAMVAYVAGARKILIWAWMVWKTQIPFDPAQACARA